MKDTIITDPSAIDEILKRGTIVEVLPESDDFREKLLSGERLRFYIGFDATAPTLHLSHAKNLMLLEKFRKLGHEVIVLFGDFTAMIGDPTDKDSKRKQLTREDVLENFRVWETLIAPLMDFKAEVNPPIIKFNSTWLDALSMTDVISLASEMTVGRMLERSMFKKRMENEKPIFLHEFIYPLMQGYDSVAMDVDVELCGTDQIFNALVGRTLQRKFHEKEKFVVAVTLMEDPKTGELMSKSRGTGVFLDASPSDMYGQIMSQTDQMIPILFVNNTYLALDEIDNIMDTLSPRDAKMRLAFEVVKIFHGEKVAQESQEHFVRTIQNKQAPSEMPEIEITENMSVLDFVVTAKAVSRSKGKRLIQQNGVRFDGETKSDPDEIISIESLPITASIGKRGWFKMITQ